MIYLYRWCPSNLAWNFATQIILDNRVVIDLAVEKLLDSETIDGEEFREIVQQYTVLPSKA